MQVLPSFDPSSGMSGNIDVSAADDGCKILLYNLSIYAIQLNFEDGSTAILHAGEANYWTLDGATPTILWTFYSKLNIQTVALSLVTCTLYRPHETLEGTYPIFLPYQLFIGNTVTTAMGGSTTWQNDNNASGTVVGETTVAGSPGSNILVEVQGLIEVLQWAGGALTQIFKTDPGAASVVKLGNTGLLTEVLGNLTVDQVLTAIGNTSLSTLSTSGKATLNSAEVTNNLTVDGTASFNNSGATIDNASAFNGSATNTTTVNTGTVNATTINATTIQPTGSLILENATSLQIEDSTDTPRTVMQVDGGNNLQFFGVTGTDLAQFLDHSGNLALVIDLIHRSFDVKTTAVSINGTSGSAQLYMPFTGANFKVAILIFNGYENSNATQQTIALPVAFSTRCNWLSGNGKPVQPFSGGSALTGKVNVNNNGTATSGNTVNSNNMGEIVQGFDALGLGGSQVSQSFAVYTFVGM